MLKNVIGKKGAELRKLANRYINLDLDEVAKFFKNPNFEYRYLGLSILVLKYEGGNGEVCEFALKYLEFFDHWRLSDMLALKILGKSLLENGNWEMLLQLAKSKNRFIRRTALISTIPYIQNSRNFDDVLEIVQYLLEDRDILIQRATGRVLREIAKRNSNLITKFIEKNYKSIKRVTLREAIKKYPKPLQWKIERGVFKPTF
ncbi:MAG TPA: DNA alkylation repair protein [Campylobacterales bacterium]|nr:DNA alkylation repair protein [Campylobacterales bacterium]